MKFLSKNTCVLLLLLGVFLIVPGCRARKGEPKEHRKIWRWFKPKQKKDFNPYVKHNKATHANSRKQKREDDKMLKEQKRQYQKWRRKSKRKLDRGK